MATGPDFALLLPPSEGKAPGGEDRWDPSVGPFGGLGRQRRKVARALAAAMRADEAALRRLLGVKGDALERAVRANRRLVRQPAALAAADRFRGVVHDHLDLASVPRHAGAEDRVIFFSALCGIVAPNDPVPDHRLKMSASLTALGRVSTWWRPLLEPVLATRLGGRVVVDLLPAEHAAALAPDPGRWAGWYRARFERASDRKVIGHDAKAAKGRFARHVLECGEVTDDAIRGFATDDGWRVESIEQPARDGPATIVVVRDV